MDAGEAATTVTDHVHGVVVSRNVVYTYMLIVSCCRLYISGMSSLVTVFNYICFCYTISTRLCLITFVMIRVIAR